MEAMVQTVPDDSPQAPCLADKQAFRVRLLVESATKPDGRKYRKVSLEDGTVLELFKRVPVDSGYEVQLRFSKNWEVGLHVVLLRDGAYLTHKCVRRAEPLVLDERDRKPGKRGGTPSGAKEKTAEAKPSAMSTLVEAVSSAHLETCRAGACECPTHGPRPPAETNPVPAAEPEKPAPPMKREIPVLTPERAAIVMSPFPRTKRSESIISCHRGATAKRRDEERKAAKQNEEKIREEKAAAKAERAKQVAEKNDKKKNRGKDRGGDKRDNKKKGR